MHRHVVIRNPRGNFEHQIINVESQEYYKGFIKRTGEERIASDVPLSLVEEEAFAAGKLGIPSESDVVAKIWIKS